MKKRLISLLLVMSMVLAMLPVQVFATNGADKISEITQSTEIENPFADVKEGDWFYDHVMYATENGLFSGISDTKFDPTGTMTRGMFVTVLGRMAEIDTAEYAGIAQPSCVGN